MNHALNLTLDTDRFAHLHGGHGGTQIRVAGGTLWLTIDGEPDDLVLERGESLTLPAGAHGLLQALNAPARAVVLREAGWRARVADAWHALTHPHTGVLS